MARVLIVEEGARTTTAEAALTGAGFAVRSVTPTLAGDVVDQLENVAVVAYLMGESADGASPYVHDEMLETVLLKVVDTGVRGFVYESPGGGPNRHIEHARETWHLSVAELHQEDDDFGAALVAATNRALGL